MPWGEVSTMSLRCEFVLLSLKQGANIAELCRRFQISRKTGYKWRQRFLAGGSGALVDRSRRPQRSPERTCAAVRQAVVRLRRQRHWGGRKIRKRLQTLGHQQVPAASTISGILRREGLIDPGESLKHRPLQRLNERSRTSCGRWISRATSVSVLDAAIR